ncbi:MAG: cache domain-containing protein [Clostridium sp.]
MIKTIVNIFKDNKSKIKVYIINSIIIIGITLGLYGIFNFHTSTVYVKNVSVFGEMYTNTINNTIEDYTSEVVHLKGDSDILSLNKEKVEGRISFLKYYHSDYKDVIVIDNKGSIYSGYVNNVKEYMYQDYIQMAIQGEVTTSKPIKVQDKWYIDFAGPIGKDNNNVLGVLAIRVSLEDVVEDISPKTGSNIEILIVDKDGAFITGEGKVNRIVEEDSVDVRTVKTSIDYAPKTPYKNLDGIEVYGVYSDLNIGGWTMLCEIENNRDDIYKVLIVMTIINILLLAFINKLIGLPCRVTFFKRK